MGGENAGAQDAVGPWAMRTRISAPAAPESRATTGSCGVERRRCASRLERGSGTHEGRTLSRAAVFGSGGCVRLSGAEAPIATLADGTASIGNFEQHAAAAKHMGGTTQRERGCAGGRGPGAGDGAAFERSRTRGETRICEASTGWWSCWESQSAAGLAGLGRQRRQSRRQRSQGRGAQRSAAMRRRAGMVISRAD